MSNPVNSKVPAIVFAVGVILFIISPKISAVYAVSGALILSVSQMRFMLKNEGVKGLLIPTKTACRKMSGAEAFPFKIGAAMLLSPLMSIIVTTLVLHANS